MPASVKFNFTAKALGLLGKNLYSNAWNALSELVANGFDARATNVYVRIDAMEKQHATIEVFDDGMGMSIADIETYAIIGFNKRALYKETHNGERAPQDLMGRKGIGKLAALYLSSHYYLATKQRGQRESCWEMSFSDDPERENETPALVPCESPEFLVADLWRKAESGTILHLCDVNLAGLGDRAYQALSVKLANCFAFAEKDNRHVRICVRRTAADKTDFSDAVKKIAFKNMVYIETSPFNDKEINRKLCELSKNEVLLPFRRIHDRKFSCQTQVENWVTKKSSNGDYPIASDKGEKKAVPYVLKGWVGIHGTIKNGEGIENDDNFLKDIYYNPNQLRLYVRNKLAIENLLNVINNSQTYANYIEGELHFDLLDDDDLPDIATSNRQGIDEHDERMELLQDLANDILHSLIKKRVGLAGAIKEEEGELVNQRDSSSKQQFAEDAKQILSDVSSETDERKTEIVAALVNKLKGELPVKEDFQVFISHSSFDKPFCDFVYHLLLKQGVKEEEVFYTSRDDANMKEEDITPLRDQIHDCIVSKNTLLFYLVGPKFKHNEYCMFEGGAGWATRGDGEYPICAIKHDHIPQFLTNGKREFHTYDSTMETIPLSRKNYEFFVGLLNKLIDHINKGRKIRSDPEVARFAEPNIPEKIEYYGTGKSEQDFMDPEIVRYWKCYVEDKLDDYLEKLKIEETKHVKTEQDNKKEGTD